MVSQHDDAELIRLNQRLQRVVCVLWCCQNVCEHHAALSLCVVDFTKLQKSVTAGSAAMLQSTICVEALALQPGVLQGVVQQPKPWLLPGIPLLCAAVPAHDHHDGVVAQH
jgi:hypothetical protein